MINRRSLVSILGAVLGIGFLIALGFVMSGWFRAMKTTRETAPAFSRSQPVSTPQKSEEQPPSTPATPETPEQADPTADWKVYRNTVHGYMVKYPPDWKVSEDESVPAERRTVYFTDTKRQRKPGQLYLPYEGISIRVGNNPREISVREWADQLYRQASGGVDSMGRLSIQTLPVANKEALKVVGIPSAASEYLILLASNKNLYAISLDSGAEPTAPGEKPKYEEILIKMLGTFSLLP